MAFDKLSLVHVGKSGARPAVIVAEKFKVDIDVGRCIGKGRKWGETQGGETIGELMEAVAQAPNEPKPEPQANHYFAEAATTAARRPAGPKLVRR